MEIGTWNGLGSTKCFQQGFVERGDLAGVRLVSLECNADKCNQAKELYADLPDYRGGPWDSAAGDRRANE